MTINIRKKRRYTVLRRDMVYGGRAGRIIIQGSGRLYTLLSAVTLLGVLCGAFGGGGTSAEKLAVHGSGGFFRTFLDSLAITAVYTGICFFGGLSSAGEPLGFLLCFFKGLGAGTLCSAVFAEGISPAAAADIVPFEAMSIALLIFAARENIRMSRLTRKRTFGDVNSSSKTADIRLYLKKFAVIFLASVIASAVDGVIGAIISI
ncbi:MAG: hypothetical protein NC078_10635 [Ruminococcus sp.]|nr:hypothetical protein [Ruminococcus sp.]